MPKYARTLETIRDDPDSFYSGELAKSIVKDIQDGGGIITLEDMKNYTAKVRTPLSDAMGDLKWYTNPPPGSGAVLSMILNILKGKFYIILSVHELYIWTTQYLVFFVFSLHRMKFISLISCDYSVLTNSRAWTSFVN